MKFTIKDMDPDIQESIAGGSNVFVVKLPDEMAKWVLNLAFETKSFPGEVIRDCITTSMDLVSRLEEQDG